MFSNFLNLIYPRYCTLCHRHGHYLCDSCKKSFKRNLPECYVCRRLSPEYTTHIQCKKRFSFDKVFVGWEYNQSSSQILKLLKYKGVTDTSRLLNELLINSLLSCGYNLFLKRTLIIPIPISIFRKSNRGFNQAELIAKALSRKFNCDLELNMVGCRNTACHRAGQSKKERQRIFDNPFFLNNRRDLSLYQSVTIVDDVITTGKTLENIAHVIRKNFSADLQLNAICLFRGKPYYI